jgi:hypothetical protein
LTRIDRSRFITVDFARKIKQTHNQQLQSND